MTVFDKRHRWGPVTRQGVFISRTCGVCGRTDRYETLVPDALVDLVLENLAKPNPYRTLFGRAVRSKGHAYPVRLGEADNVTAAGSPQ